MTCHAFVRQLYHFQADELSASEHRAMSDHMDECPDCAQRLAAEDVMLRGVKDLLREQRAQAPAELRESVQSALKREATSGGGAAFRAPWLMPLAASILVALFLLPGMGWTPMPEARVVTIDREVTLVDLECDLAGKSVSAQRNCKHPRHLNALKVGGDEYWNVGLDVDAGRLLAVDASRRGHRLRVKGEFYPGIRTLHIEEFSDLGVASLSAQTRRGEVAILAGRFP